MSLKFLNLKGFHPGSQANQKRVWIAEQTAKAKAQREAEAAAEVRKAADAQRFQELAAANGDAEAARRLDAQQVGFLYAPPPGLAEAKDNAKGGDEDATHLVAEDDAAREFRRKIEKSRGNSGADDVRRNLERYVGRRPDEPLTIKDQVERFPFLKDAPVEGEYTDSVKVNFKPVGKQLRNVRCLRCGQWGHQSGDRECELRDFNPHDAARQVMEDPMTLVKKHNAAAKNQLILKQAALPLEMQGGGAADEFTILPSEDEDASDPERAFLARLSSKEKKRLLKKLMKQQEGDSSSGSDSDSSNDSRRRKSKSKKKHRRKKDHKKSSSRHHRSRRDSSEYDTPTKEKQEHRHHRRRSEERGRKQEKISSSKRRRSRSRSRSTTRDSTRRRRDS